MARLRTLGSKVKPIYHSKVRVPDKRADAALLTPEHRQWREAVLKRAGYRCEEVENGQRCTKAAPHHRMFADHIVERKDGGAPLDPGNGRCLCGEHHTRKTNAERAKRHAASL